MEKAENKPIFAFVDDMLFASKIRATAETLNLPVRFLRSVESAISLAEETIPNIVIVDLQSTRLDPFDLGKALRSEANFNHAELLGFYSHVNRDIPARAKSAGYDRVMTRSLFSKDLAEILLSYFPS